MEFPIPANEAERIAALDKYNVFRSAPEAAFDDVAELAAQLTGATFSMVSFIGPETAAIKARHAVPPDIVEVPRGAVCCAHTVCQTDLFVCPDTHEDDRFKNLPFIGSEPFVRFYAGMPLIDSGGYALGSLCVMDLAPRELDFETGEAMRRLARQAVAQLELRIKLSEVEEAQRALADEKRRADDLILNILPAAVAKELTATGHVLPRHHPSVTIMFVDFVDFTKFAGQMAPRALIDDLDRYFSIFDEIVRRHGLEKLKTIGDAYMCAGGLTKDDKNHAAECCLAALDILRAMARENERRAKLNLAPWNLRIGIHTGNVMSGVVGKDKFTFDIWGDTVNVAARMQSASRPGRINLSDSTYQHVKKFFTCESRGSVEVKTKGAMAMYFLDGLMPDYARDAAGLEPNDKFAAALAGATTSWSMGA
jgi:class 3 adenylate cyclase